MRGAGEGVGSGRRELKHCTSNKVLWHEAILQEPVLASRVRAALKTAQKCTNKKRKNRNGKYSNCDDRLRRSGFEVRRR